MTFCTQCGKSIKDGSVFCPYCGSTLTPASGGSRTEQSREAVKTELPVKTEPVSMGSEKTFCTQCGKEIKAGSTFCIYCGAVIAAPVGEAVQAAEDTSAKAIEETPAKEELFTEPEESAETTFCTQCGKKIKAGSTFCIYCGAKLAAPAAVIGAATGKKPAKEKPVKEEKPAKEKPVKAKKEKPAKEKPVKEKPAREKPVKEKPVKQKKAAAAATVPTEEDEEKKGFFATVGGKIAIAVLVVALVGGGAFGLAQLLKDVVPEASTEEEEEGSRSDESSDVGTAEGSMTTEGNSAGPTIPGTSPISAATTGPEATLPEETTQVPVPAGTTPAPAMTTAALQTTAVPETTTAASVVTTTAVPETTTAVPETTTAVPETTTAVPETTVAVPETTTAVPETTTAVPETTTAVPETTVSPEMQALLDARVGDSFFFGTYEQDGKSGNGKEEIEWIVFAKNDTQIWMVSRYILDVVRFNNSLVSTSYESCDLRAWLNGTFLNRAFSSEELAMLAYMEVESKKSVLNDRVTLLSVEEIEEYLTASLRRCKGTAYAINSLNLSVADNGCSPWWTRTMGKTSKTAVIARSAGDFNLDGRDVDVDIFGVRPVISFMLEP